MKINRSMYNRLQALLVILLAIFLAQKFWSGQLFYYIGPRFSWLSLLAVVLLIAIAGAYDLTRNEGPSRHEVEHDHPEQVHTHDGEAHSVWPLALVALPLVLGVVVPATPLGASAVATRGMTTEVAVAADQEGSTLMIVPGERNVLDWVRAMNANSDPAALNGEEADIVGFVYRDARFNDDQFMVGRFTITCCVADALAIGLVVQSDEAANVATEAWVRVTGTFKAGTFDGTEMPVLHADSITPVQQPEQPYLYP